MNSSDAGIFISKLTQKCRIQGEPAYTGKDTFQFVVNHFYNLNKSIRMGVQVTNKTLDIPVLRDWLGEYKVESLVDLRAYVEVPYTDDVKDWGPELLYHALVTYAFQRGMDEKSVQGIRMHPDVSYEFFDIEKITPACKEEPSSESIQGVIYEYYSDRSVGFIRDEIGNEWAFHTDDVICSRLKNNFLPFIQTDSLGAVLKPISVGFENGGRSKYGHFKKAIRILKPFENLEY